MEEKIMEKACDLCHWPYVYGEDNVEKMLEEKCDNCPLAMLLDSFGKE